MRRTLPGGFELDDDRARIDVDAVHAFMTEQSYWGRGRSRELQERAIRGSARVVGLYLSSDLIGFARAVSDGATVAYLADVYVLPGYRGRGLGLELVREIVDGESSSEVRWLLHTADAQGLYSKLGFSDGPPLYPLMERGRRRDAGSPTADGASSATGAHSANPADATSPQ
ncbi:MAG TPA: GNAT family N-acetyltransferase [Solirubrobacteraceae bacterium]|jgi:GNAT superfamily N-acetyltransferase|nr:GNAT family N-acetyltransferase [Solirubrobacteraceae bacterium]